MLIQHYAEALSQSGGVGIADSLVRELMRMQANAEAVDPATANTEAADGADR
jgi:Rod binding domain-containing protein